jgi:hypothetical protein
MKAGSVKARPSMKARNEGIVKGVAFEMVIWERGLFRSSRVMNE